MSQEDEIRESLNLIQQAILTLDKKIEAQGKRIVQLEQSADTAQLVENPDLKFAQASVPAPPPVNATPMSESISFNDPIKSKSTFAAENKSTDTLEENIGGKWFMRIGIAALFLGISFFLKYAFDNDWIGETGRVMIGILIGLGLLGIGEKTIHKYFKYGQMTSGAGIAVLYLSIFSAFNFYHIIDAYGAFFVMIIITAIGIVLSLRYDAMSLLAVAIVGGFATPIMASTGQNNQMGLLSYITLLDLAILTVAIFKKWHQVSLIGFLGTILLFLSWGEKFYTRADLGTTMFFLTLFFVIFSISSLVYNLVKKEQSTGIEQLLTLFSAIVYFASSFALLNHDYHAFMGFFALILAIYYFLWAYLVRNLTENDENLYGFLAFLTVGFVTLAIPLQFEQNVITISWAIEAVLLMLIGVKLKRNPIVVFSILVTGFALLRYFFLDSMRYNQDTMVVFNNIFLTAVFITVAAYVIAFVIRTFSQEEAIMGTSKKSLIALFLIVANFMTIFAISREIIASYDRDINVLRITQGRNQSAMMSMPAGRQSDLYLSDEYKLNQEKINKLENKSSISLSLFWLCYAIGLIALGVVRKSKGVRIGGLVLLLVAIFKLFFIDLWSLGTLYRIISSMSLGVVLLAISFVYQKYKEQFKEMI